MAARRVLVILAALLVGACSTTPASTIGPGSGVSSEALPSGTTSTPSWSASAATLPIDDLPPAATAPPAATGICDAYPDTPGLEFGGTHLVCVDTLLVALRDMTLATPDAVTRLYLKRPCLAAPCSPAQLDVVTVYAWTQTASYSLVVDAQAHAVSRPALDPSARLPEVEAVGSPPPVARPDLGRVIPTIPPSLASRAPYPYCSEVTPDGPASNVACFENAVLDGTAAEVLLAHFPGSFNGGITSLDYRYAGSGPVLQIGVGDWATAAGALVLSPFDEGFFEPWSAAGLR